MAVVTLTGEVVGCFTAEVEVGESTDETEMLLLAKVFDEGVSSSDDGVLVDFS